MFISKKKYEQLETYYDNELTEYMKVNEKLQDEIQQLKYREIEKKALDIVNKEIEGIYNVIGFEYNKKNDLMVVLWEDSSELFLPSYTMKLISLNKKKGTFNCPTCYIRENNEFEIKIVDIFSKNFFENIGNGSIMLNQLKKKAKLLGYKSIVGELSFVDIDKFDKLENFYKKNDFEVSFHPQKTSGSIKLTL